MSAIGQPGPAGAVGPTGTVGPKTTYGAFIQPAINAPVAGVTIASSTGLTNQPLVFLSPTNGLGGSYYLLTAIGAGPTATLVNLGGANPAEGSATGAGDLYLCGPEGPAGTPGAGGGGATLSWAHVSGTDGVGLIGGGTQTFNCNALPGSRTVEGAIFVPDTAFVASDINYFEFIADLCDETGAVLGNIFTTTSEATEGMGDMTAGVAVEIATAAVVGDSPYFLRVTITPHAATAGAQVPRGTLTVIWV